MPTYSKESLDQLRERIDLVDVLSAHLQLHRSGSSFKALCPFHDEKTPSFLIQSGDTHYHCFGCGAHGDAIQFLMTHVKMTFVEAVEYLAERFHVVLEKKDGEVVDRRPLKSHLRAALNYACQSYHYLLLNSEEAVPVREYLQKRGIDRAFIEAFEIGFAPKTKDLLLRILREAHVEERVMEDAGLATRTRNGELRDFFSDRILFPIRDPLGSVIGFSGRKYKEETFGGKYINTPETPLFKKSQVLFGLNYSRQEIIKTKTALIVEGQIDALRLIHLGFRTAVAGQGTAFGADHVKELIQLGVRKVFLALDGDVAGREAAVKIGHLFQKKGVDVQVVPIPEGQDPDQLLKEEGPSRFEALLNQSIPYLPFLFQQLSLGKDLSSPAEKNALVSAMVERVKTFEEPVMIHESLKKIAELTGVPESAVGVGQISLPDVFIKRSGTLSFHSVDPNRILEADLLRWLLLSGSQDKNVVELAQKNLKACHFLLKESLDIYTAYMKAFDAGQPCDLLSLSSALQEEACTFLSEVMQRKINVQKAEEGVKETLRKMLIREWMARREEVRAKIHQGNLSDSELLDLAKTFDQIKKEIPELIT